MGNFATWVAFNLIGTAMLTVGVLVFAPSPVCTPQSNMDVAPCVLSYYKESLRNNNEKSGLTPSQASQKEKELALRASRGDVHRAWRHKGN